MVLLLFKETAMLISRLAISRMRLAFIVMIVGVFSLIYAYVTEYFIPR